MGESKVDAPKVENKMGESAVDAGALQVSISFGRFENDSLCWEKWSAFPSNKYLEEVEKCSTPGSVAQKKAYFEAHYKKIAARKAELLDQEKKRDTDPVGLEDKEQADSVSNTCMEELDAEKSYSHGSVDEVELEYEVMTNERSNGAIKNYVNGVELENEVTNLRSELSGRAVDEPQNDANISNENGNSLPLAMDAKDELCSRTGSPKFDGLDEAVLVKEDSPSVGSHKEGEHPNEIDNGRENSPKENKEKVKSDGPKKSKKVTTVKKATNIPSAMKKQASPKPKPPLISTPKQSKPALSKTSMSATRPSAEKKYDFTPLTTNKIILAESKRLASTSLHMSLSLDPANSDPGSLAITRKSLIMERMGDKDIVKRAFKTFQSQLSSSSLGKSLITNQVSRKAAERNSWVSETFQKSNERMNKAVKKASNPHGQEGTKTTSIFPGLLKTAGANKRNVTTVSSSFGVKKNDIADKWKVVEKEFEIKKLQQSLYFKAKPMPSFYREVGISKSAVHKNDARTNACG
ncbi:hypothetical protein Nepgr_017186 [Nepenthes gracilis]|uniref:TPX2 C-terminal domain-containing protein n=1 Tax=Nepenthes gracilis TaxID=150966 RepID=A0AAD3XT59_NEPGR|nr:hypothetical protein Nepgr_017186 [Nepenthes gracilis]